MSCVPSFTFPGCGVFLPRVPVLLIAHSVNLECHRGDGGAVRAVSLQLLEKVHHLERRRPASTAQADGHGAHTSICPSFTRASSLAILPE